MHVFEGCESEVNLNNLLMVDWRMQKKTKKLRHNKLTLLNNDSINNVHVGIVNILLKERCSSRNVLHKRKGDRYT